MKRLLLAACIVSLTACGGGKDDVKSGYEEIIRAQGQSLVYAFPGNDQLEVPTPAPVVLNFSSPVADAQTALQQITIKDAAGNSVVFSGEVVDDGRGLVLTPTGRFDPLTRYQVSVPALVLQDGTAQARVLSFTTRGLHEGPKSLVGVEGFTVLRTIPDGQELPVSDMSSLRIQSSQPLDRTTLRYGETIALEGEGGVLIDAHLVVSDRYITVDPKQDLTPGKRYTLLLSTGVKSSYGEALAAASSSNPAIAYSMSFTPIDTRPPATTANPARERAVMLQDVVPTGISPLTGKNINLIPMASVLLGEETATQAQATMGVELAHLPSHPDITPLRISRGALIEGESIEVLIGGLVPAGFDSGKVGIHFISDATGYLVPNPFSSEPTAAKQLRLWMDVAVTTEDPKANGAITQDILHIELVGTALVDKGVLTANAVGVVEPDVLGAERARGLLSFYMEGREKQGTLPPLPSSVFSVMSSNVDVLPGTDISGYELGSPVVVNFNAPVDPATLDAVTLRDELDQPLAASIYADGSAIVITPLSPLRMEVSHDGQQEKNYRVVLGGELADIRGNTLAVDQDISFAISMLPGEVLFDNYGNYQAGQGPRTAIQSHSPIVLSMLPGYPCYLDPSARDLSASVAGRCAGGSNGVTGEFESRLPDDLIPVLDHPSNHPIVVLFSKEIDPASVVVGKTFKVYRTDNDASELREVKGEVSVYGKTLIFNPDKAWVNGALYAYSMASAGFQDQVRNVASGLESVIRESDPNFSPENDCSVTAICDLEGLPLQTQVLAPYVLHEGLKEPDPFYSSLLEGLGMQVPIPGLDEAHYTDWVYMSEGVRPTAGGPTMTAYFRGAPASKDVIQVLSQTPLSDPNGNLIMDREIDMPRGLVWDEGSSKRNVNVNEPVPHTGKRQYHDDDLLSRIDPEGLMPAPNFIKLLSTGFERPRVGVGDLSVGCGWNANPEHADQFSEPIKTGVDWVDPVAVRQVCPESKFSALTSSLIVLVTNEVEDQGVKIKIVPGVMLGASLFYQALVKFSEPVEIENITSGDYAGIISDALLGIGLPKQDADQMASGYVANLRYDPVAAYGSTGPQLMRMRYAEGVDNKRNRLIDGWLTSNGDTTSVKVVSDIYINAPEAAVRGLGGASGSNLFSYPSTVNLSGQIDFLDDGRMMVSQYNDNEIVIAAKIYSPARKSNLEYQARLSISSSLIVPSGGLNLQFVSESIK